DASTEVRGYIAERGEATGVVRPILTVRAEIGIARTIVEMGCIQDEEVEALRPSGQQCCRAAKQALVAMRGTPALQGFQHGGRTGNQRPYGNTVRREGGRKRPHNVRQAARLYERIDLRGG